MELKKSKTADLESKRIAFSFLGGIIACAIVLMAFTYKSVKIEPIAKTKIVKESLKDEIQEEFIQNEPPPPPPPAQAPPPVVTEVEEVEDDIVIEAPTIIEEDVRDFSFEEEVAVVKKKVIYDVVGVNPQFPGGDAEMAMFIQETFEYPEIAKEMSEQGTVYIQFVVNKDGTIVDAIVVKGVSPSIDKEALRVVKKMPKWKPGEQAGKPVNVRYTIPIRARLG